MFNEKCGGHATERLLTLVSDGWSIEKNNGRVQCIRTFGEEGSKVEENQRDFS